MAGPELTGDTNANANSTSSSTERLAVIGGTSLINSSLFAKLKPEEIDTEHGKVQLNVSPTLVYVNRHHTTSEYAQPGRINHRATFCALKQLGITKILAVCSVGSLNTNYPPGSLILPDDYFALFDCISTHYYNDYRAHIIPTLCKTLRQECTIALNNANILPTSTTGVYVQTRGPRFETRAEIKYMQRVNAGDVIGMTSASEGTIAAELNLPYQPLCMVDNFANGIGEVELTMEQFQQNVAKHQPIVERAVQAIVNYLLNK